MTVQSGRFARVIEFASGMINGVVIQSFATRFPIAQHKHILVKDAYINNVWTVDVSRNLQDWEVNEYVDLLHLFAAVNLYNSLDRLLWDLEKNRMFTVNSLYHYLAGHRENGPIAFPIKMVWKSKAPSCISFLAWKAVKEHNLTVDNLMKIGKIVFNRCFLYKCETKSSNHIMLWCLFTYSLWCTVYGLLGIK